MRDKIKEKYYIVKAINKDPDAFSKVYDIYVEKIYRFTFFKVNTKEDAQDITSEVFLKTWQYILDSNKEIKNLNALLYKIARNLIIDHYRKSSQKDVTLEDGILKQQEIDLHVDQIEKLDQKMQAQTIEDQLHKLKDEYREVIILRYIEGLSISEIAQVLEKKKGNIRVIIYRAVNTLKKIMEEEEN